MTIGSIFQGIVNRVTRTTTAPRVDSGAFRTYANYYVSQVNRFADDLGNGDITTDVWLSQMRTAIHDLHLTAYVIGAGGLDNITSDDLNNVAAIVNVQYGYLDNWATELRAKVEGHMGTLLPNDVQAVKSRAQLYLMAANATLQAATTSAMGLPDLPAYPGDCSTECCSRDKCVWVFRKVPGGWDCTWKLNPAEHCPTCLARAQAWNPLQIRDGELINPGGSELFFRR